LALDQTDTQLPRFLRYLVAAIEENFPHTCMAVSVLLHENPDPTIEVLADALTNSLAQLFGRLVLILDDLHFIDNTAIYALLARVVQYAPPTFHLVLSTRVDPPLPLNRWRAQGWLNELRMQELSFTVAEAASFLEKSLASPLSAEAVAALHRYTEGWPVGMRLAALALRGHADPALFLTDVAANSDRYVIDYLRDDVLEQQPAAIQQFLICTAVLQRFCPALCAAVLQIKEAVAQQQLDLSNMPISF
jgi:LuxR family maltose regulon positive regulatory protein